MGRLGLSGIFVQGLHSARHQYTAVDSLSPVLDVGGAAGGNALRYFVGAEAEPRVRLFDGGLEFGFGGATAPNFRIVADLANNDLRIEVPNQISFYDRDQLVGADVPYFRIFPDGGGAPAFVAIGRLASAGTPLVNSPVMSLRARYWDGAASQVRGSEFLHVITAVAPTSRFRWQIPNNTFVVADLTDAREFIPGADNAGSLGLAGSRWNAAYISALLALGTTPAASGILRLPNAQYIVGRNAAGGADVSIIGLDANDDIRVGTGAGNHLVPAVANQQDLGLSGQAWNWVYVWNGVSIGNSTALSSPGDAGNPLAIALGGAWGFVRLDKQARALAQIYPSTPALVEQTACALFAGTGVPNNANGANGDIYFRSDGGAATTMYQRRAGAWVATAA